MCATSAAKPGTESAVRARPALSAYAQSSRSDAIPTPLPRWRVIIGSAGFGERAEVELIELSRDEHASPFVASVLGFDAGWWRDLDWATRTRGVSYFQVVTGGDEIARAVLVERRLSAPYAEFDSQLPTIEVDKFEVRADCRRRSVGRTGLGTLRERFPDRQVVAFSYGADRFWAKVGFELLRRADGDAFADPLFVARPLRPDDVR